MASNKTIDVHNNASDFTAFRVPQIEVKSNSVS